MRSVLLVLLAVSLAGGLWLVVGLSAKRPIGRRRLTVFPSWLAGRAPGESATLIIVQGQGLIGTDLLAVRGSALLTRFAIHVCCEPVKQHLCHIAQALFWAAWDVHELF